LAKETKGRSDGFQGDLRAILEKSIWFSGLPSDVQNEVIPKLKRRRFEAGEALYHQGEKSVGIWGLLTGSIHTIGTSPDGNRSLLSVLRAGEWTGLVGVLDRRATSFAVIAAEPVEAVLLPYLAAQTIFMQSATRMALLARPIAAVMRFVFDFLFKTAGRVPKRILAQRLVDLADSICISSETGQKELMCVSQDDLAAAARLTRPTVNRILRQFADEGWIRLGYRKIDILNERALEALAHADLQSSAEPSAAKVKPAGEPIVMPRERLFELLIEDPWFAQLSKSIQNTLLDHAIVKSYRKGHVIFEQGEEAPGLYAFLSGQGRAIGIAPDGRETLLAVYHGGNWIGHVPLIDDQPAVVRCRANAHSLVASIPADVVQKQFQSDPNSYAKLLIPMLTMLRVAYRHIIDTHGQEPERVVAERLYGLASIFYASQERPRDFVDNLSQSDLANVTGLSRPTVNKVLQAMSDEGIVAIGYGRIKIINPEQLLAISQGTRPRSVRKQQ
jgi:CRP/FNR family transcriptional regulator, cyclic AMP receptor protein